MGSRGWADGQCVERDLGVEEYKDDQEQMIHWRNNVRVAQYDYQLAHWNRKSVSVPEVQIRWTEAIHYGFIVAPNTEQESGAIRSSSVNPKGIETDNHFAVQTRGRTNKYDGSIPANHNSTKPDNL